MTPELLVLALVSIVQLVQYIFLIVAANLELGMGKTLSPRDRDRLGGSLEDLVTAKTGRLFRTLNNNFEALILFTIAVVVVHLSGQSNMLTHTCAWVFFVSRLLYGPAYFFGWVPWRTYLFLAGFIATFVMIIGTLLTNYMLW